MSVGSTQSSSNNSTAASSSSTNSASAFTSLTPNDFLQMMIAELQNQDPTQPMSTSDILQEVSQIGSIETNSQLTQTLQSVALGENVSTAASLIGRTVAGTNSSQQSVTGTVDGASVQNGAVTLSVGGQSLSLSEISAIQ